MSVPKLQVTKNYRLFSRSIDNRPLSEKNHKKLLRSMQRNGFLPCFPLACVREPNGNLIVYDGQHRLAYAETLGLPVYFVVLDKPFDIAEVNCAQEKWNTRNFAETFAAQNKQAYKIGLEFTDRHQLPIGIAFGLLAGTCSFTNIQEYYYGGTFKVKDMPYAEMVGAIYSQIIAISPIAKNARLIEACMAIGRVKDFDSARLVKGCERCREKLVAYSTRDAYLDVLEIVYNFGRKQLFALKNEAVMAMRERNAFTKSKVNKAKAGEDKAA
jgi:hypothetical protein